MPSKSKAEVLADLGMACFQKGENEKGKSFLEQGVPLAEADGQSSLLITMLMNLGVIHTVLGDFEASAKCLEKALSLQEAELGSEHADLVGTLQNLTVVYSKLGQPARAAVFMERAGKIKHELSKLAEESDGPKIVEVH
mmetsp:Transcript_99754/g.157895  ORF Transcript_99754/g.157895 Transcript_99754/m.157895 type:complete len:139 (-) Transcript_99754:26-442(-)